VRFRSTLEQFEDAVFSAREAQQSVDIQVMVEKVYLRLYS